MPPQQATIQYHATDYIGDPGVLSVIQWLNARPPARAKRDPVEQVIQAFEEWRAGTNARTIGRKVKAILMRSKLVQTPSWYPAVVFTQRFSKHRGTLVPKAVIDRQRWRVEWDAKAKGMGQAQALALQGVLDLASAGLLWKIRECDRAGCSVWFCAKKRSQRFHSPACQQFVFRHDTVWMAKHALEMRARRAAKKAAAAAATSRHSNRKGKR